MEETGYKDINTNRHKQLNLTVGFIKNRENTKNNRCNPHGTWLTEGTFRVYE